MLSPEDNAMLTQVGPGTPMGELFRRFWLPALLSEELPANDGVPVRVRLLGEDLIAEIVGAFPRLDMKQQFTRATYDRATEALDLVNGEIEGLIKQVWARS